MFSNQSPAVFGAAKNGTPSLSNFTNTFILSSTSNTCRDQVLSEIPKALTTDPARQRRVHQKSRAGCESCRRRRVKCDGTNDGMICTNCSRRGEQCQYLPRHNRVALTPSIPQPVGTPIPSFRPTDAAVNLHHLKLFHHFHTCTRHTLMLTPEVWDHAVQLSFQFEFLMNTILCITAHHLAFLQPDDVTYRRAAVSHLHRAVPMFRQKLSHHFTSMHIDAFIATSLLLQYEAWASTDLSPDQNVAVSFDPTKDRVFTMGSRLKEVFLKSVPLLSNQPSKFLPLLRYNPHDNLVASAQTCKDSLTKYQQFVSDAQSISVELLGAPIPCSGSIGLAVSSLWEHHEQKNPFPMAQQGLRGPFATRVQQGDPHALSLLYHFYRAARILVPSDECWWAHKGAAASEANLKKWLMLEGSEQINV